MKRFLSLIICIAMSMCLFTGCGNKQENSKNDGTGESSQYNMGRLISEEEYQNESLKLKYTLLSNMKMMDGQALKDDIDDAKQSMNEKFKTSVCVLELAAQEDSRYDAATIKLMSYKLDQEVSEDDFVEKTTVQPTTGTIKIGNVEFRKAMSSQSDGKYILSLVKKINNYFVVISVTAENEEKANKLLSGFSKF